ALNALKEALTAVYWYKSDLRSFLTHALSDPALVGRLNWDDYKRNIVSTLVEALSRDEEQNQAALLRLMLDVASMSDFSHLSRLERGAEKAAHAREAVAALNELVAAHGEIVAEQEAAEK